MAIYQLPVPRSYTNKPPVGVRPYLEHPHLQRCSVFYPLNEGGGSVAYNAMGPKIHQASPSDGTIQDPNWDPQGPIVTLNSTGQTQSDDTLYYNAGANWTKLSIEYQWIQDSTFTSSRSVLSVGNTAQDSSPTLLVKLYDTLKARFWFDAGYKFFSVDNVVRVGERNQVVITYDGTKYDCYFNGLFVNTYTGGIGGDASNNSAYFGRGHQGAQGGISLQGKYWFDYVVPPAQVKDMWLRPWAMYSKPLPIWIPAAAPPAGGDTHHIHLPTLGVG